MGNTHLYFPKTFRFTDNFHGSVSRKILGYIYRNVFCGFRASRYILWHQISVHVACCSYLDLLQNCRLEYQEKSKKVIQCHVAIRNCYLFHVQHNPCINRLKITLYNKYNVRTIKWENMWKYYYNIKIKNKFCTYI